MQLKGVSCHVCIKGRMEEMFIERGLMGFAHTLRVFTSAITMYFHSNAFK